MKQKQTGLIKVNARSCSTGKQPKASPSLDEKKLKLRLEATHNTR